MQKILIYKTGVKNIYEVLSDKDQPQTWVIIEKLDW